MKRMSLLERAANSETIASLLEMFPDWKRGDMEALFSSCGEHMQNTVRVQRRSKNARAKSSRWGLRKKNDRFRFTRAHTCLFFFCLNFPTALPVFRLCHAWLVPSCLLIANAHSPLALACAAAAAARQAEEVMRLGEHGHTSMEAAAQLATSPLPGLKGPQSGSPGSGSGNPVLHLADHMSRGQLDDYERHGKRRRRRRRRRRRAGHKSEWAKVCQK
jgi:hypothetical protein